MNTPPSTKLLSESALAKTYINDPHPVKTVEQFREAHELRETYPDKPRAEIAREVGRKPSAVRRWLVDGATPRLLKGIEVAKEHDWLPLHSDDRVFEAFNQLVA